MNESRKMDAQEVLKVELEVLRREHRDLDDAISALQETQRAKAIMSPQAVSILKFWRKSVAAII